MDCQSALEFLDCVRPGSDDLCLAELADARSHLEGCPSCQAEFERRQKFDAAVCELISDIPVPETLLPGLLAAVAGGSAASLETATVPGMAPRRRHLWKLAAGAVCALAVTAIWLLQPGERTFSVAELLHDVPLDLNASASFDQSFQMELPASWIGNPQLRVLTDLRGVDLDDDPADDGATALFHFRSRRGEPFTGLLVTLPANRVSPLPEARSLRDAHVVYLTGRDAQVAAAWQEGSHVYLCFLLNGDVTDLDELQRSIGRSSA